MLTHLDLFSGIGGFALACQWAGIETACFVEIDKYCQKVLRKHWPNVPIVEDIRDVKAIKEVVANATSIYGEGSQAREANKETRNKPRRPYVLEYQPRGSETNQSVTLITGGFPCQPFSVAGKRGGKEDNRYLWPEMFNIIKEIRPTWVLGENVAGIVRMELDTCISDLEGIGYTTQTFIIPACAINAWHRRDRVWIIAHSKHATPTRQREYSREVYGIPESAGFDFSGKDWWAVEPKLGRVAHGIPHRVDRLKCLGNAIVPQVAYEIVKVIKEVDIK